MKAPSTHRHSRGFTLIELIGVLLIILILATVLLPDVRTATDDVAINREKTELAAIREAYKTYVIRNRIVPGPATWTAAVATVHGNSSSSIASNARGQTRQLVVHPAIAPTLPYTQTSAGRTTAPTNAFALLVSSVHADLALPSPVASTAAEFTNLWNRVSTATPAHFPAAWTGNGAHLVIEQIDIGALFHEIAFNYYPGSTNIGYYTVDNSGLLSFNASNTKYYLSGTTLGFAGADATFTNTVVHGRLIVRGNAIFNFVRNAWRSDLADDLIAPFEVEDHASTAALGEILTEFLASDLNPDHDLPSANLNLVVQGYTNYANAYIRWATNGQPMNNTGGHRNNLRDMHPPFVLVTEQLIAQ